MSTTDRPTVQLDPDLMARVAEDAGRAASQGRVTTSPFDTSPALRDAVLADPDGASMTALARLYRASRDGALDPATD